MHAYCVRESIKRSIRHLYFKDKSTATQGYAMQ